MLRQEIFHFHLCRVIENNGEWVQSTHTVEITTEDPFRTGGVILDNFPGWEMTGFSSETDRRYRDMEERR